MRHLGDLVPYACTINEPNLGALLHGVLGIPDARGSAAWAAAAAALQTTPERFTPLQNAVGSTRGRGYADGAPARASTRSRACGRRRGWG